MSIGLCLISYKRPQFLKKSLESLHQNEWGGADYRIVEVDEPYNDSYKNIVEEYKDVCGITFNENKGVGINKNRGLKKMMDHGCQHLFLMEDDTIMKSPITCHKYIDYAMEKSLGHLNFALHGNQVKLPWRMELHGIVCYPDCVGAFSYYHRGVIESVGYLDEAFVNAWEHVEHTMRIAKMDYTTPFWFFADHPQNSELLEEQPESLTQSSIRPRADWGDNVERGKDYWISKHGRFLPPRPNYAHLATDLTTLKIVSLTERKQK
jgi:GT2 family glycosyltransferase